jgi:hypothetical protein
VYQGSVLVSQVTINGSAPVADAGEDIVLECEVTSTQRAQLDGTGSSDRDGDTLEFEWSSGGAFVTSAPNLSSTFR